LCEAKIRKIYGLLDRVDVLIQNLKGEKVDNIIKEKKGD